MNEVMMAKFAAMEPRDVVVGRERAALEARRPYAEALLGSDAGRIELERGDKPGMVKRYLHFAAKQHGIRVRSSWEDSRQSVLLWRKLSRQSPSAGPKR